MRFLTHALAFALEVALLFSVGLAGYRLGQTEAVSVLLAVAGVAAVVGLWGVFAAPKSKRRLRGAPLVAFKTALFALATVCLALFASPVAAAQFFLVAAVYMTLALRLGIL